MLDVDEFYRTGSPSINLGFAHPETRTSSIMDFKVCKANIARTQTEATVFIDWADCCCCGLVFVRSQFSSRLPDIVSRFLPGAGRYQILYTDYQNFAILWSCSSLANLGYTGKLIRSFFFANLTPTHSLIHFSLFLFFGFDCRSNLAHVTRTQRFLIGNSHDNPWCVDQIGTGSRTTGAQQEPELSENTLREHLILYLALNYIYKTRIKLL